ncbi:MAG: DUF4124 domain-containing protein [Pseudomonadales bacterium]
MSISSLLTIAILASLPWQIALAGEIVTWVDADGVTHFGNPQLAPMAARSVEVAPANGMAVPEGAPTRRNGYGPATVILEKKPNRELVGWRGHQWNASRRPQRRNHR